VIGWFAVASGHSSVTLSTEVCCNTC